MDKKNNSSPSFSDFNQLDDQSFMHLMQQYYSGLSTKQKEALQKQKRTYLLNDQQFEKSIQANKNIFQNSMLNPSFTIFDFNQNKQRQYLYSSLSKQKLELNFYKISNQVASSDLIKQQNDVFVKIEHKNDQEKSQKGQQIQRKENDKRIIPRQSIQKSKIKEQGVRYKDSHRNKLIQNRLDKMQTQIKDIQTQIQDILQQFENILDQIKIKQQYLQ